MVSPNPGGDRLRANSDPNHGDATRRIEEHRDEPPLPAALVTGWSQALASLTAWARRELFVFGGAVSVVILLILGIVYRNARFWLLHAISLLAAAAGTIATLKLVDVSRSIC